MNKILKIIYILSLSILFSISISNYIYGSELTDIEEINKGFLFSEDVDNDMSFNTIENKDETSLWNKIYNNYKIVIVGSFGLVLLNLILFLIINVSKLNIHSASPELRKKTLTNILWIGIALALLGSISLIIIISQSLFK